MRKREPEEMKDSGIEWIGEIPKEWEISKIKHVGKVLMGGTPSTNETSYWDGEILWVTPADVDENKTISSSRKTITDLGLQNSSARVVPAKSIILSTRAPIGSISINTVPMSTNQGCKSIVLNERISVDYAYYYLKSITQTLNSLGTGTTFLELSTHSLRNVSFPLPPLPEQQRIADYLDRETGRLDSLVSELGSLKTLLLVQRKSLISECVTKGIPAHRENRAYKDSGVEWIGEVPEGWEIKRLKNIFAERKEKASSKDVHLTPSQKYGTLPQEEYMRVSGVKPVLVLSENATFKKVYKGDFISHLRTFQGGLEVTNYDGKVSQAYTIIYHGDNLCGDYNRYLMKSSKFINLLDTTTAQLRDGQSIKWKQLSNLELPLPSLPEQQDIADYLDKETSKIDALIGEIDNQVNLIKVYRKSLINEVVTGKIEI